jgi:hypothetical protein
MPGIRRLALAAALFAPVSPAATAETLGFESVNAASFDEKTSSEGGKTTPHPVAVKLQILLDRNNMSPGVIDGRMGENVTKATPQL